MATLRTIVYVDGFKFYYRCLKGTPYRWLNLIVTIARAPSIREFLRSKRGSATPAATARVVLTPL